MADRRRLEPWRDGRFAPLPSADRHPGLGETELGGFFEPRFGMANRAHITREGDFAKHDSVRRHSRLGQG